MNQALDLFANVGPFIAEKKCGKCGGARDRAGQRYCRACHAKWMRENRPKYRDLSDEQRAKNVSRSYANTYQKRGKLVRSRCVCCGSNEAEKHHHDYTKPLDVTWLCKGCHQALHNGTLLADARRAA